MTLGHIPKTTEGSAEGPCHNGSNTIVPVVYECAEDRISAREGDDFFAFCTVGLSFDGGIFSRLGRYPDGGRQRFEKGAAPKPERGADV